MSNLKRIFLLVMLFAGILILPSCEKENLREDIGISRIPSQEADLTIDFEIGEDQEKYDEDLTNKRTRSFYTFRTLNAALHCTELNRAIFQGRKSLYAPSDAAFAKLGLNEHNVCDLGAEALSAILLYHVAEGSISLSKKGCLTMLNNDVSKLSRKRQRFFINDSRIYLRWRQRHLRVYAINEVLTPPASSIAETASAAEQFATLFAAVLAAEPSVAMALSDEDASFTLFAPTNEAFVDLLSSLQLASLDELVAALGQQGLTKTLLYHVVEACAFSNDLKNGQLLNTLQGEDLQIDLKNLNVIDKTDVPAALIADGLDIITNNGVVHTIDKVLLPKEILDLLNI